MTFTRLFRPLSSAVRPIAALSVLMGLSSTAALAASPWENAVQQLQVAFTGPIARGLSLVAVVIGGLLFAYGESDAKRTVAGIVFGVGMAVAAVPFMNWLFG